VIVIYEAFDRTMRMLLLMSGATRQDKIRNGTIGERVGVAAMVEKMVKNRLMLFGHVERRPLML